MCSCVLIVKLFPSTVTNHAREEGGDSVLLSDWRWGLQP